MPLLHEAIDQVGQRKAHEVVGQFLPFASSPRLDDLLYLLQVFLDLADEAIVSEKSLNGEVMPVRLLL